MAPTSSMHPLRDTEASPGQQVPAHKVQTRRRWVFRTSLILSLSALLLCFLVMWRRDEIMMAGLLQSLDESVAALQDQVTELGRLPATIPELSRGTWDFYASAADRFYASQISEPVIIAATRPIQLLLKEEKCGVVIYQQGKIEAKWMTVSEYKEDSAKQKADMKAFEQQRESRPLILP